MKHDRAGAPCDGAGNGAHDVGVTGLALFALLCEGSTLRGGQHQQAIQRAVRWLRSQQDPATGLFGTDQRHDFIYDHAIAALAMAEAYGRSQANSLRQSAQGGLDYLERHRNPNGVWRYQPMGDDDDTSVTCYCVHALAAGARHGLRVNPNAQLSSARWFDGVTDASGRCGYTKAGEPSSRHPGDHAARFPVERTESLTAAALWARLDLGQRPAEQPLLLAAADRILAKPPTWDRASGALDPHYWMHASRGLAMLGGSHWPRWQGELQVAAAAGQRTDGNFAGSFDPVDTWGIDGGRVATTSLMALALLSGPQPERVLAMR